MIDSNLIVKNLFVLFEFLTILVWLLVISSWIIVKFFSPVMIARLTKYIPLDLFQNLKLILSKYIVIAVIFSGLSFLLEYFQDEPTIKHGFLIAGWLFGLSSLFIIALCSFPGTERISIHFHENGKQVDSNVELLSRISENEIKRLRIIFILGGIIWCPITFVIVYITILMMGGSHNEALVFGLIGLGICISLWIWTMKKFGFRKKQITAHWKRNN